MSLKKDDLLPLVREIACNFGLIEYYVRLQKGSLAQPVEQLAFNQLVARSNRARPTNSANTQVKVNEAA